MSFRFFRWLFGLALLSLAVGGAWAVAQTTGSAAGAQYGGGDHQYGTRPGKGCGDPNHTHTGPPGNPTNTACPPQSSHSGTAPAPSKPAKSRKCATRKAKAAASKKKASKRRACKAKKKKSRRRARR